MKQIATSEPASLWRWGTHEAPVGSVVAAARKYRGLTQQELARRLSLSSPNISRIEHGSDLRVSTLLELARELRLEPALIPKEHVGAVRSLLDHLAGKREGEPAERPRFA